MKRKSKITAILLSVAVLSTTSFSRANAGDDGAKVVSESSSEGGAVFFYYSATTMGMLNAPEIAVGLSAVGLVVAAFAVTFKNNTFEERVTDFSHSSSSGSDEGLQKSDAVIVVHDRRMTEELIQRREMILRQIKLHASDFVDYLAGGEIAPSVPMIADEVRSYAAELARLAPEYSRFASAAKATDSEVALGAIVLRSF